jgi:hypothetical protein
LGHDIFGGVFTITVHKCEARICMRERRPGGLYFGIFRTPGGYRWQDHDAQRTIVIRVPVVLFIFLKESRHLHEQGKCFTPHKKLNVIR